jgi:hypothetical protein
MRAVAAGVAEPALLKDEQTAKSAFELHKQIFFQNSRYQRAEIQRV